MTERRHTALNQVLADLQDSFHIEMNPDVAVTLESNKFKIYYAKCFPRVFTPYKMHDGTYSKSAESDSKLSGVYAFVVIEHKLRIGLAPHAIVANKARAVQAAGDLHFQSGKISKVTDQSGTYHVQANDLLARHKQDAARIAMKAAGLPMDKFEPFSKPLIYSKLIRTPVTPTGPVQARTKTPAL